MILSHKLTFQQNLKQTVRRSEFSKIAGNKVRICGCLTPHTNKNGNKIKNNVCDSTKKYKELIYGKRYKTYHHSERSLQSVLHRCTDASFPVSTWHYSHTRCHLWESWQKAVQDSALFLQLPGSLSSFLNESF